MVVLSTFFLRLATTLLKADESQSICRPMYVVCVCVCMFVRSRLNTSVRPTSGGSYAMASNMAATVFLCLSPLYEPLYEFCICYKMLISYSSVFCHVEDPVTFLWSWNHTLQGFNLFVTPTLQALQLTVFPIKWKMQQLQKYLFCC